MKRRLSLNLLCFLLVLLNCVGVAAAQEQAEGQHFLDMSFEDLLMQKVSSASGIYESLADAPAAVVVITKRDIKNRGYRALPELLADLPGFDTIVTHGSSPVNSYQRGYRTPFMQRTLMMIDGKVDNLLWSHAIETSMQYPLANVERIEILYGPASAVYGPNAFLGIINIITKNSQLIREGSHFFESHITQGSYNLTELEVSAGGKNGELGYSFSARFSQSDGADLNDFTSEWGYLNNALYGDRDIWGGLLEIETQAGKLGQYGDPSNGWGMLGEITYEDIKFGYINWFTSEAYGAYYPADHAQSNALWENDSSQYYLEHTGKLNDSLEIKSLALYRESYIGGNWAEAEPDLNPNMEDFSYISFSSWNTLSNSVLFKQDYDYIGDEFRLTAGIKYERKELTKAYDICSYWSESFCSSWDGAYSGPHGLGPGIFHSTDDSYLIQPGPLANIPSNNLVHTTDKGIYAQGIWDLNKLRINTGIRYDSNSLYGDSISPRSALIYHLSNQTNFKLLYGEAFQEPPAIQLFGGWSGRQSNPELKPEQTKNLEFILMHQTQYWLHDISFYSAHYEDVIKEEADNAGERNIKGIEYRGRFSFDNFLAGSEKIDGYLYYTYTDSISGQTYDHTQQAWIEGDTKLGDIAPHKINAGINIPYQHNWNINLRANYVGEREFYTRNPLREQNEKLDSYLVFDATVRYVYQQLSLTFVTRNLFEEEYLHPGVESANSGNDFTARAGGYQNSALPQEGRSYYLTLSLEF